MENGADWGATAIAVVVNKRATDPYVMCRDNGKGIPLRELLELPENVCNSIKRRMKMKTGGVHGIGLLGYNTIGNRLKIISRARGSADTNAIELIGLKQYKQIDVERPLDDSGTEVYIYGVDKDKKLLEAVRLAEYLAEEFEQDLVDGKFKLEIQQGSLRIPVTRDRIVAGTPIIGARKIATEWGDITVNINFGGKGGVALTRHGITITNNISNLPDFEGDVWKTGKIGGFIRFDSINVSTDKKSPIRDERFKILITKISELEPELVEAIKKLESDEATQSRERLLRYLASRLDEVLKDLQFDRIRAMMEANKRGELEAPAEEGQGASFGGEGDTVKKRTGKPPVTPGGRKKSLRSAYGINWEFERDVEHPKSRSSFDPKFGTIKINEIHPDYDRKVRKSKSDLEKLDYFYKLAIKEIVLHQYDGAPPSEVLEKLLDLQIAMEKSPPSL